MEKLSLHSLGPLAGPERTTVLLVDVQRVFTGMPLSPPVAVVLGNLRRFLDGARALGVPVIVVRNVVPPELSSSVWRRQHPNLDVSLLNPGTLNVDYEPGFEPSERDVVVTKPRYSAFVGTPLEAILRVRDVHTVVVAGLTTDVCVGSAARDAFQRDLNVITLADCCAEMTQARNEAALATLAECFGTVCASTELLACWRARPSPSATPPLG
ncbi:MAG: cysteine hydrolase family protein [Thermomicrobiales bacterium]